MNHMNSLKIAQEEVHKSEYPPLAFNLADFCRVGINSAGGNEFDWMGRHRC